ncbi:hypothetical protein CEP51_015967 [Fusarium floridanum]|uniref:Uncharacterized protein n=1 Tax=Fusarium floridanum TaxID=1325733 RepID=A0A428NZT8_9HYPO|nr:hypothetical protein CEP51_015967 [Fusarium floridanum]
MDDKHRPEDIHVTGSPAPGTGAQHAERLTPYNAMIVQAHEVPSAYCIPAAVANWLFLAGFVVFPGTFTTISQATALGNSQAGRVVQHAVQNTPLLVVGSLCCFIGGAALGWDELGGLRSAIISGFLIESFCLVSSIRWSLSS